MRCEEEKTLSRTIYFLARDIQNLAQRLLEPYNVTLEQFYLLKVLSKNNKNLTQREICQKTSKSAANITRIIDRLENKSLVIRRPCLNDRRAIIVALTKKGQLVLQETEAVFIDFSSRLSSGIDTKTLNFFNQAADAMTANVIEMSEREKRENNVHAFYGQDELRG